MAAFSERLHRACPDRPVTVVVDDAHWLDSHSARLLAFLARSNPHQRELIVVGRSDENSAHWPRTLDDLTRTGATSLAVDPFGIDELTELIGLMHPRSSSRQRSELGRRLVSLRAELPLVAGELIAAAEGLEADDEADRTLVQRRLAAEEIGHAHQAETTDLDEVLELSDRVFVLVRGQLTPVPDAQRTREAVGALMLSAAT